MATREVGPKGIVALIAFTSALLAFVIPMVFPVLDRLVAPLVCPSGTVRSIEVAWTTYSNGATRSFSRMYCMASNGTALLPSHSVDLAISLAMFVVLAGLGVGGYEPVRARARTSKSI